MNYEEVKKLLENIRGKKRLCLRIQAEIRGIRDTYDALTCSIGESQGSHEALSNNPTQRLALRVVEKQERLESVVQDMMDLEDVLAIAIKTLSPAEQDIIIGYYMQDKTHYQLAKECSYSERSIRYHKGVAIAKLSKRL